MFTQLRSAAGLLFVAAVVAGAARPVPPGLRRPANRVPTPRTPTPSATAAAVVPPGPYAIVVTHGAPGLIVDIADDLQAQVDATATASCRSSSPIEPSHCPWTCLNDLVYCSTVTSTSVRCSEQCHRVVKTMPQDQAPSWRSRSSPDDQHIAVSAITRGTARTPARTPGTATSTRISVTPPITLTSSATRRRTRRWPVGWHGTEIIDAVGNECGDLRQLGGGRLCRLVPRDPQHRRHAPGHGV